MARNSRYHVTRQSIESGYDECAHMADRRKAIAYAKRLAAQGNNEVIHVQDTAVLWRGKLAAELFLHIGG